MKKLCLILLLTIITIIYPVNSFAMDDVNFYISIDGIQLDKNGDVQSRPKKYFTDCVATTTLKSNDIENNYLSLGENVTEEDILEQFENIPKLSNVFDIVIETYKNKGYIKDNYGNIVPWSKLNTYNYTVQWYVLKYEKSDGWHCDGRIINKLTNDNIEIILPEDPKDIPDEVYEENKTKYRSNYAYIFGYDDDTIAGDKQLIRCEASQMIYRVVKQNKDLGEYSFDRNSIPLFNDTGNNWFRSGIEYIAYKNGFNKVTNNLVKPYEKVTRGETFRLICIGMNFTDNYNLSINDYTNILVESDIIIGDESGNYNIDNYITRAEFCVMTNRILGRENALLETEDGIIVTEKTYGFKDLDSSKWYYKDVLKASSSYNEKGYVDLLSRILDDYS